jgi:hypothetical protein
MFLLTIGEMDTDHNNSISKDEFLAFYVQVIQGLGCRSEGVECGCRV